MARTKSVQPPSGKQSKNKQKGREKPAGASVAKTSRPALRADPRVRLIAFGDALFEPPVYRRRDRQTPVIAYHANSALTWLRTILPEADIGDEAIHGVAGETAIVTSGKVAQMDATLKEYDAALVSTGLQDCFRAITGNAPAPEETVASLEAIANTLISASVRPIILVPPPCPQFANGLFADRYLAVSATLRRIARQRPEVILVDATEKLKDANAFGVEPAEGLASGDQHGRVTARGAIKLAEAIAESIRHGIALPPAMPSASMRQGDVLTDNPLLHGTNGGFHGHSGRGHMPDGYLLDAEYSGGLTARVETTGLGEAETSACRIAAQGRYSSNYPFMRIMQTLPESRVAELEAGDGIEAIVEYSLSERRRNLAAVQVQLVPVWANGFLGLRSVEFTGENLIGNIRHGVVHTPQFAIPGKLRQLSVSVTMYFTPGTDLDADATLDIHSVVVRKADKGK